MKKKGLTLLVVGLVTLLLSACGGGATKPTISIPVIEQSKIYTLGKYFNTTKYYSDRGSLLFSSKVRCSGWADGRCS